jgi:para-aminobenzoate synthetase/4-amino-4-deoxychorismate lyase
LGLQQGQILHEAKHLHRMEAAAAHFGYRFELERVKHALRLTTQEHPEGNWRLRLLLSAKGDPKVQAFPLMPTAEPVVLALADRCFEAAHSEFVRFKTTRRAHYDAFEPSEPGVFDTLLWNNRQELTECTRGNVALLLEGRWLTPALESGLLNGVGRQHWLEQGRVQEAVLHIQDLQRAQEIVFINSLRGWLTATLKA